MTEVADVREDVAAIQGSIDDLACRVARSEIVSGSSPVDPRFTKAGHRCDIAHKRISFIGFPASATEAGRIKSMETFMSQNFPHIPVRFIDNAASEGPPGKSKITQNGFVEVGSSHYVTVVMNKVKQDNLKLDNLPGVVITRGISDLDRRRNWALHKAGELIRADPAAASGNIETNKKERTISANGVTAYSQKERYDPDGTFEGVFRHLRLP